MNVINLPECHLKSELHTIIFQYKFSKSHNIHNCDLNFTDSSQPNWMEWVDFRAGGVNVNCL